MENIVISLTTIQSRIKNLPKVINSILNKNTLPNIIHIFYSDTENIYDKGCSDEDISIFLDTINSYNNNNKNNVEIKLSKVDNYGSYRKIIPALRLYRDHIIITIDDDEIFESDLIGDFIDAYVKYKCVICSVGRIIDLTNWNNMNDTIDYYNKIFTSDKPYMNILPEGYGGILYHSNMFDNNFINFDYNTLEQNILKNDDIFIRYYTYNLGIPVFVKYVYQSNMYNTEQIPCLFKLNKKIKLYEIVEQTHITQFLSNFKKTNINFDNLNDIQSLINLYSKQKNDVYKKSVHTGTDVKKLQYRINYNSVDKYINLHDIIQKRYFPDSQTNINTVMINIEKDVYRYDSAIREFKKLLINDFIHLKATFWREKVNFTNDMSSILNFCKNYNSNIVNTNISLDLFSVFDDQNIMIQDGPLACYCSHVRGIIYGFLNFSNYTIIVEDDFHINDIDSILENITKIPDDWDIICIGAQPINQFYDGPFYKFTDLFHSTHFYIIRNSSMETIFKNIYPIYDQIDILLSKLHNVLNIYNIPNAILQKNFESNTQNNLFVIYNSPNYEYMRTTIHNIKSILFDIIYSELKINPNNCNDKTSNIKNINNIVLKILFDVIFSKILSVDEIDKEYFNNQIDNQIDNKIELDNLIHETELYNEYFVKNQKQKLYSQIYVIINGCIKGINVDTTVKNIINNIYNIIHGFSLTNTIDTEFDKIYLPLNYGSTSNVYLLTDLDICSTDENVVVKVYNKNLRWTFENHTDYFEIIQKEINILNKLESYDEFQHIIKYSQDRIYLKYVGESLFDNFILPENWIEQIKYLFEILDNNNILYPEFNLKNITFISNKLYLIDFGLATIVNGLELDSGSNPNLNPNLNHHNLINFIEILQIFDDKFKNITDIELQHVFYNNFITNIKLDKNNVYNINIF
jgi:predicted Ser/Thr protein kinase